MPQDPGSSLRRHTVTALTGRKLFVGQARPLPAAPYLYLHDSANCFTSESKAL